jgi:hypothetical protein
MTNATRDELIDAVRQMPKKTSYEDAIEHLALLSELKHRMAEIRSGKVKCIPHAQVIRSFERRWSK